MISPLHAGCNGFRKMQTKSESFRSLVSVPLTTMIGISLVSGCDCISRWTSRPLRRGRARSSTTAAGRVVSNARSAASPFDARQGAHATGCQLLKTRSFSAIDHLSLSRFLVVYPSVALRQLSFFPVAAAFICLALSLEVRGQTGPVPLPDGAGKDLVSTTCSQCHSLNLIPNSWGYTRDGWQELFSSMVAMPGMQASVVADYLATHFPEKPNTPQAVIIPGPVEVNIREWLLPTIGQRPHDPLAMRDGSIWWTGQYASRLGRLDPTTGAAHEYPLQTRNSGPHGLVEDLDGNVWYTGINVNHIGRLDPMTGIVTEYPMPDPQARGPHTPIFDQQGILFFTLQSGHVGRLKPATGEVDVSRTPTSRTYPYGIQVNSKGVPWYVDFNGNRVGRVDPVTLEIKEYTLPEPAARPRRIALTPDDAVWYTDYARGYLGRFDPVTGQVREWPSPGGRRSQPYGIASVGHVLWYSESGVKPNTLVRFDSTTEAFQTWAIPSGGGVVRNMMATPDGNLVLACSGVNRVALVEVSNALRRRQEVPFR